MIPRVLMLLRLSTPPARQMSELWDLSFQLESLPIEPLADSLERAGSRPQAGAQFLTAKFW